MSTTTIQAPVLVRNTKPGPTVFHDPTTGSEVTWQGANDPMGDDVQVIPPTFLASSDFLRSLSRGIFVIESAPEDILAQLDAHLSSPGLARQAASWKAKQANEQTSALEHIDHTANNDIVAVKCIGPSTRGDGQCGAEIPVRDNARNEKAPLCAQHAQLASQFVPTEDGGWTRAALAPRQTYQPIVS